MAGTRLGKRERMALKAAQATRKAVINANLTSPVERDFHCLRSSIERTGLLLNSHTRGFHEPMGNYFKKRW